MFTSVLLADEINRATPRTQAALLEAMAERQVTVDGDTRRLPEVFLVLATQNPVEFEGTFPLPEAQLDRFLLSVAMGYPTASEEQTLVERQGLDHPVESLVAVAEAVNWAEMCLTASQTLLSVDVSRYLVSLVAATRDHPSLELGASPRASLFLAAASRAVAAMRGRDFVLPDDVKGIAGPVLSHRLVLSAQSRLRGIRAAEVIDELLGALPVGAEP